MIPYHEESIIPTFALRDGEWVPSKRVVFAGMVGCDRPALLQIGYLGDSITQGIGTDVNSYDHWNAMLSDKLGEKCAYWNLGLDLAGLAMRPAMELGFLRQNRWMWSLSATASMTSFKAVMKSR
ncbi:MAG: hypothetical protein ACLR23_05710 [Clostridia bacterium]